MKTYLRKEKNKLSWQQVGSRVAITNNEIHFWFTDLQLSEDSIRRLREILSSDEKERADRFCFEKHRRRFTVARGVLRIILGRYLDMDPGLLKFAYSKTGKPELAGNCNPFNLRFNLSHSHEYALYSITQGRDVGVDIEYICSRATDLEQLAERFFSHKEYAEIKSLPPEERKRAFYRGWTRKEAYLKATGEGLAGLEEVVVSINPEEPAELLSIKGDQAEAKRFEIVHIDIPNPDYMAACVVEGRDCTFGYYRFDQNII